MGSAGGGWQWVVVVVHGGVDNDIDEQPHEDAHGNDDDDEHNGTEFEDSDFIVDADNMINEDEVDMEDFRAAVDKDVDEEHLENNISVSRVKVFRAKAIATHKIEGDFRLQYELLRDYCAELIRSNPGTSVKIEVEREFNPTSTTRQFKRIYICLGALKEGFKACGRKILGLDGCFMKGPYPGQILTDVGIDSNNDIYPVAYAMVEAETTSSWTWFLNCLGHDLYLYAKSNFTFISDRQKGIIPALEKVYPNAEHKFCLRHVHENMKFKWSGHLFKNLLWKCATATTIPQFEKAMTDVRIQDQDLHDWLQKIPPKHWSKAYFSRIATSDVLLNNLSFMAI
ncbi:hypothetical protein L1987_25411 [Smallanthus sonchifolius]|uniref:Uncharacterized protein n=1 Tax=Smallanthus sonchifolius TaxID=185202 RepID=A0ACB9IMH2_9ASTR|nr:hypothetical protein L1987_25411 [Smallanthus sonchifolius]